MKRTNDEKALVKKSMDSRKIFGAIVYVLRTGIQWKALPGEYGSSSSIYRYFQKWKAIGFFRKLWEKGLAEYDDFEEIGWCLKALTELSQKLRWPGKQ